MPDSVSPSAATFEQRFDVARAVLERKYRWARTTIRNLTPVAIKDPKQTFAVDKWGRLYYGPAVHDLSDQEFIGGLWHEVHHVLRHHQDRLEPLTYKEGKRDKHRKRLANESADCEVNDDLRDQGITLPEGSYYSEVLGHDSHITAEEHFGRLVHERPEPPPGSQGDGDGEDGEEGDSDGQGGKTAQNGSQDPEMGSQGGAQDSPSCGSGSGGDELPEELEAPEPEEQDRVNRNSRKQDEEIVDAVENGDGMSTVGGELYRAAVKRLDRQKHDWRSTFQAEVRNAIEQRSDEAEEYTFKRASRRAASFPDIILPGSYRPIPQLGIVVDVSGSMDKAKLGAAMREVHTILERLAMPEFYCYPTTTAVLADVRVRAAGDVETVFQYIGGSTDMRAGIKHALERGDEVIIVLTDCQTNWPEQQPPNTVFIIGGINRTTEKVPDWARFVAIEGVQDGGEQDG